MRKARNYEEYLLESLKSPEQAATYLNAAMEEGDPALFLVALRDVAKARGGGMSRLARQTRLNRENLYSMLSKKGNPALHSLEKLLDVLGFRLTVSVKEKHAA